MTAVKESIAVPRPARRRPVAGLLAAWLLFVAVFLGLRFFVLPAIDDYRPALERSIGAALGQDVRIGRIAAQWQRFNPELVLEDFEPAPLPIHVVFQQNGRVPAKVNTFVDFLSQRLGQDPALNAATKRRA